MHVRNAIQYMYIYSLVYRVRKETSFDKNIWCARIHNNQPTKLLLYSFIFIIFVSHGIEQTAKRIIGGGRLNCWNWYTILQ